MWLDLTKIGSLYLNYFEETDVTTLRRGLRRESNLFKEFVVDPHNLIDAILKKVKDFFFLESEFPCHSARDESKRKKLMSPAINERDVHRAPKSKFKALRRFDSLRGRFDAHYHSKRIA